MSDREQKIRGWIALLLTAYVAFGGFVAAGEHPKRAELRVRVMAKDGNGAERRIVFAIRNLGSTPFSIPKRMLPTSWVIERKYQEGATWKIEEQRGGVGPGRASKGYRNRYADEEYATLPPAHAYEDEEDLNWYLRFPGDTILPGQYALRFYYSYEPSEDESDLNILSEKLDSNEIQVVVEPSATAK